MQFMVHAHAKARLRVPILLRTPGGPASQYHRFSVMHRLSQLTYSRVPYMIASPLAAICNHILQRVPCQIWEC